MSTAATFEPRATLWMTALARVDDEETPRIVHGERRTRSETLISPESDWTMLASFG